MRRSPALLVAALLIGLLAPVADAAAELRDTDESGVVLRFVPDDGTEPPAPERVMLAA